MSKLNKVNQDMIDDELIDRIEQLEEDSGGSVDLSEIEQEIADTKSSLSDTKDDLADTKSDLSEAKDSIAETKTDVENTKTDLANTESNVQEHVEDDVRHMTEDDREKLNSIETGAQVNAVDSVNGQTGEIVLGADDVNSISKEEKGVAGGVASLNAEGKVIDADGNEVEGKVKSVNGKDGEVVLSAEDVGAETPVGAQEKADEALSDAKEYADGLEPDLSGYATEEYVDGEVSNHADEEVKDGEVHGLRIKDDKLEYFIGSGWKIASGGVPVGNVENLSSESRVGRKIALNWKDPEDRTLDGEPIAEWQGTTVIRKKGSYPSDSSDGDLVENNTERDKYESIPFVDEGLEDGSQYYYMLFPYTEDAETIDGANRTDAKAVSKLSQEPPSSVTVSNIEYDRATVTSNSGAVVSINGEDWFASPHTFTGLTEETSYTTYAKFEETDSFLESKTITENFKTESEILIYGIKIDENNSNPVSAVTYTDDAIGMSGGSSDWDDIYPFSRIRPVLYKDGNVVGELDRNNFSRFTDGSSADITSGNAGDVMIEFPKVWWKIERVGTDLHVKYATKQEDSTWKAWGHTRGSTEKDFVYIGAYLGCEMGGKLRSVSGNRPTPNKTIGAFRTSAQANGDGYEQMGYFQLLMLQILYLVRYKSRDSQSALGRGYVDGNNSSIAAGGANTKGMYFGETTGKQQMKFAGVEDFYGNMFYWIDGLFSDGSRNILIGTEGFNDTGSGYTNYGQGSTSNLGGYIGDVQGGTETGFIIKTSNGSATTHYADYGGRYAGRLSQFGGHWSNASHAGAFRLSVDRTASTSLSNLGARLLAL